MTNKINLDETIEQMFPLSAFPTVDEQTLVYLFRAYSIGFKDGFSKRNPDATIEIVRKPTVGEYLNATQQEGP